MKEISIGSGAHRPYSQEQRDQHCLHYKQTQSFDGFPAIPENLQGEAGSGGKVTLVWETVVNPDLAGYHLFRGDRLIARLPSTATYYTDHIKVEKPKWKCGSSKAPETSYDYRILSIDKAGNKSLWSEAVSVTVR